MEWAKLLFSANSAMVNLIQIFQQQLAVILQQKLSKPIKDRHLSFSYEILQAYYFINLFFNY